MTPAVAARSLPAVSFARPAVSASTLAAVFIAVLTLFRLVYVWLWCPLDLAPDEAHYWDWSRQLDWSYYSKGPLVAWVIRASCELLGPLSIALTGTETAAVRTPAALCGALLLTALYVLARKVLRDDRSALACLVIALPLPVLWAGSVLMTIDAPYTAYWAWACVCGLRAVERRTVAAWALAGLVVGVGCLAKYTMVLWFPSVGLFLLTSPRHRRELLRPTFWSAVAVAGLCCLPILLWNWRHDWVSFRHVQSLTNGQGRAAWSLLGPLRTLGEQAALLLGFWFVAWVYAVVRFRPTRPLDERLAYCWWLSVTTMGVFAVASVKAAGEMNWPVASYVTGLVLVTAALLEAWPRSSRRLAWAVATAGVMGTAVSAAALFPTAVRPAFAAVSGPVCAKHPIPLRRFDPTCRLRGWHYLGDEVRKLVERHARDGVAPEVAAASWSVAGELAFHLRTPGRVYCFGPGLGRRQSQYDLWHPNPLAEAETFHGRTFIYVGDVTPEVMAAFERLEPTVIVTYREAGHAVAAWPVTVGHGYRGFAAPAARTY